VSPLTTINLVYKIDSTLCGKIGRLHDQDSSVYSLTA